VGLFGGGCYSRVQGGKRHSSKGEGERVSVVFCLGDRRHVTEALGMVQIYVVKPRWRRNLASGANHLFGVVRSLDAS
jgi:hypothetical protein